MLTGRTPSAECRKPVFSGSYKQRSQPCLQSRLLFFYASDARAMCVHEQANAACEVGLREAIRHAGNTIHAADACGTTQRLLGDFGNCGEPRASADEDASGAESVEYSCLPKLPAQHLKQLARAGLEDFSKDALRHQARGPVAH